MPTSTMVLKQGEVFVVADERGEIGRSVPGAGVYFRDTRFLSDYHLLLNDEAPDLLDSSGEHNAVGIAQFGNPYLRTADGQDILPNTISLRRYRLIDQGVLEQLELRNFNRFAVDLELTLTFGSDFRDIFDIRGFRRTSTGRVLLPRHNDDEVILGYRARDGVLQELVIHFNRVPDETTIEAGAGYTTELEELRTMIPGRDRIVRTPPSSRPPQVAALFHVHLEPQGHTSVDMTLSPREMLDNPADTSPPPPVIRPEPGSLAPEWFTAVRTNHEVFDRLVERSLRDLRTLVTPFPGGGRLIAAGIPWYVAPFGRDAVLTALQLLMFSPELAVDTLRALALKQGTKVDPWTEEEPGKILHEQRFGEMARLAEVPHVPYYGTVDATPLFIVLFCETMRWVGSRALFDEFHPAIERALEWVDRYGDGNGDGFVDYGHRSRGGLVNQGWKDSDNSLQFPDQSPIAAPVALVEVQGYVYQAKRGLAEVYDVFGKPDAAHRLRREAEALRKRFEERFWSPADDFYGQAIDGSGRLVDAISSNPGHCLFSGIASPERAAAVARRLRGPDMYSGWGIRTLSAQVRHYNPMSYHNGSVWPHDNALIVAGLRRYGYDDDANAVFSDLVAAATHFEYGRLPELFCGFSREFERYTIPISYPVSCSPQAWAAGALPYLLQVVLGLEPDALNHRLTLRPCLPDWLETVQLRGLRIAGLSVDVTVVGRGYEVDVSLDGPDQIEVVVDRTVTRSR
ncbi:MAG TPA: glycogen debranching N-terminal domain-containing protein [Thermomicrobiaceae bacterium]|nr:glycogen debranching N-terminal domain-containing protein [Thermomicrobiaceae bacterium]